MILQPHYTASVLKLEEQHALGLTFPDRSHTESCQFESSAAEPKIGRVDSIAFAPILGGSGAIRQSFGPV